MAGAGVTWTDERVGLLRKLWVEGLSASQIAAQIGPDVSRNAVIGKLHRLGLSGRGKAPASAPGRARKSVPPSSEPPAAVAPPAPVPCVRSAPMVVPGLAQADGAPNAFLEVVVPWSQRVTIMELRESMCRWPLGDPTAADFRFCGGRAISGMPYCPHHAQIAYQPAAERKRLRA